MKLRTNTGEVELTAEMVCLGMVFETSWWSAVVTVGVDGWTAEEIAKDPAALFLGCDPTIASRADCERFGVYGDAAAHGFARLRDGGAVDLRRADIPWIWLRSREGNEGTYRDGAYLVDGDVFIGLDARYARPGDVDRLCCGAHRQWVEGDRLRDAMCTLAIGPHEVHEDNGTGTKWRNAPKAGPRCACCYGSASVKQGHALKIALQASNGSMESGAICDPCAALVHVNPEGWMNEKGVIRSRPSIPAAAPEKTRCGARPSAGQPIFDSRGDARPAIGNECCGRKDCDGRHEDIYRGPYGSYWTDAAPLSGMRYVWSDVGPGFAPDTAWLTFVHYGPLTAEVKMRPGEFRCSCGATTPEHAQGCAAPFWLREASAAAWAQMPDVQKAANAGREAMVGASVIGLFVFFQRLWEASPKGQRAKREAALVALVNNVPAGLRPDGWRAAVLACHEARITPDLATLAWWIRQPREENAPAAVVAYHRAIAPRVPVAPERKTRGPAIVVDDGRDE